MKSDTFPYPLQRIGIIGGGQLGKMTAQVAKRMGFYVTVLDRSANCPSAHVADALIVGDLYDGEKLRELASVSDVLTYEIEHIDTETLKALYAEGKRIYPAPRVLEVIQDKFKQKQLLEKAGVPVPRYQQVDHVTLEYLQQATLPLVQKARTGGYDGKGVAIIKSLADIDKVLPVPSMVEEYIPFSKEIAVMVARSRTREVACYPVVEMVFDERTNICDIVAVPARVSNTVAERAKQIAMQSIEALDGVGVFGVEMFLTENEEILVNEIAPRPHNSGHYTIEASVTSQFEQLVRIVCDLPLGSSRLLSPVAMWNLLGEEGYQGQPVIEGLRSALSIKGLSFHLYGKDTTQAFRKMGHITIVDESVTAALEKVEQVKTMLKIKAE
ncbi:5-(carboxyamino)imidazole ribonucleotide synthase [Beggiatoa leptomitoformis]|uniref:N5-carboxyaminoimidazole ribonucleotide synthase n=1 Tax=Beggiatoa leptomitoformis TaxID=288004 RepID=A0A2N9YCJ3_9GAMM|nr:5-(carboxyamino)imidazole ribonucleotide synthase [Beggiatoa leptomitoformis]ALG66514.1 5-(carboxyamino)imidazole ribonucleotide synthase [Beggiatoa leptomitoformis]AUI68189.1 5-(carboxyamino)imidazole ribonucleotide synthase [Beggiatoa leptomitoformis]